MYSFAKFSEEYFTGSFLWSKYIFVFARSLKIEFFCEGKLWMVSFLGVASYIHPQGSPFRYSQDFETKFFREECRISTLELLFSSLSSDPSPPFPPSSLLSSSSEEEEDKEEKEEEHAQNTNPLFLFLDDNSRAIFRNNMTTTRGFIMERFFGFFCFSSKGQIKQVDDTFDYSLLFGICCDGFTTCMCVCVELELHMIG